MPSALQKPPSLVGELPGGVHVHNNQYFVGVVGVYAAEERQPSLSLLDAPAFKQLSQLRTGAVVALFVLRSEGVLLRVNGDDVVASLQQLFVQ